MVAAEIINERQKFIFTFCLFIINLVYSLAIAMIRSIMVSIYQDYNLRLYQGGFLLSAQSLGGVIALCAGVFFIDKVSKLDLVLFLFLVFGLMLTFFGLPIDYYTLIFVFSLLGISTKLLEATANALIADIHPGQQGTYLTLLHAFFSIGVFLGPLYSQILLHSQIAWKTIFLLYGILCIVILFIFYFCKDKEQLIALNKTDLPGHNLRNSLIIKQIVLI